jgi:secreted trypsin-like serine protease
VPTVAVLMSKQSKLGLFGVAILLGTAACSGSPSASSAGGSGQAVIGGTVDQGDPAVVALVAVEALQNGNEEALCTGTIISPHVVLTAAHCVPDNIVQAVALVGTDLSQPDTITTLQVTGGGAHPSYNPVSGAHDVGYMVLADASTITPVPYNRAAVDDDVGQTVRVVGFGVTSGDKNAPSGVKETASLTMSSITSTRVMTPANSNQPCHGDSGGPLLLTVDGAEQIAGLVSRGVGTADDCAEGSANIRVDSELDFIDGVVAQVEGSASSADTSSSAPPSN